MLDLNKVDNLLKEYHLSNSLSMYSNESEIGLCYQIKDNNYGTIKRAQVFKSSRKLEEFLKLYIWYNDIGKKYNVKISFNNYNTSFPNITYLLNGKPIESNDILNDCDLLTSEEVKDLYIKEAFSLLDYAKNLEETKKDNILNISILEDEIKNSYYTLQLLIDKYNKVNIERKITKSNNKSKLPKTIKQIENYNNLLNSYKNTNTSIKKIIDLINKIIKLCLELELDDERLNVYIKVNELKVEKDIINREIDYMKSLFVKKAPLIKTNLKKQFKEISKYYKKENKIRKISIKNLKKQINLKYSFLNNIDILKYSKYLDLTKENKKYKHIIKDIYSDILYVKNDKISITNYRFKKKIYKGYRIVFNLIEKPKNK